MSGPETALRDPVVAESLERSMDALGDEVSRAVGDYGADYASAHEAYGVLVEEVAEFFEQVRLKRAARDRRAMLHELTQVAAVAIKYRAQIVRELDAAMAAVVVDRGDGRRGDHLRGRHEVRS